MDTLVELYVNEQFDDLAAALTFRPRRTVFLTTGAVPSKEAREGILRFLRSVDPGARAEFVNVGSKSTETLMKKLGNVLKKYPGAAVELTGGSPALLLAAERFCAEHNAKAFYLDPHKGRFRSICGMEGEISRTKLPKLTVPKLILMGGGVKLGSGHSSEALSKDPEVVRGILEVYRRNIDRWNGFSEYLQFACRNYCDLRNLFFCAPSALLNKSILLFANKSILSGLSECGAIRELTSDGENYSFYFKNGFVRDILTTVGMCLELYIYLAALDSGRFDSAEMSVVFDWDGVIKGGADDTTNELDVVLTRGFSSFFISCKTARPDTRDLYEISFLASRFGGRNAEAVLATAFDLSANSWANYLRARDMGVTVIERADIVNGPEHVAELLLKPKWLKERPR